jgi:UDP:flavonoid glycosyltransferase YjiC (YdhE family)
VWRGPPQHPNPLNFGEILHNFGYRDAAVLRELIEAWRVRLRDSHAVIANVAPAAHIAARTLGIPSFEVSQGFHVPPPAMPSAPLRDWEPAPRARLESADRSVLVAINAVLAAYGVPQIVTLGELFAGRSMLLTYPELDIYPERGPAEYFGIPLTGEGSATPPWPAGRGPRVLAYLYAYYAQLEPLLKALAVRDCPTLAFVRGLDAGARERPAAGPVLLSAEPLAVTRLLRESDLVICHASHQMTAQALLAGKPVLLVPTQLEQFLIMRRVVRQGAGLGIAPDTPQLDFAAALEEMRRNPRYCASAQEFARRYSGQDRAAALDTIVRRCEAAIGEAIQR